MDLTALLSLLDSTIRLSVPLVFAGLAGLYSERAGVVDIGLEGKMLVAAFAAGAAAYLTGSAWLGLLAGILASILFALIHGLASITYRGNQIVSGVAINILAAGITVLLGIAWFAQGGRTPALPPGARFLSLELPLADALGDVPVLGPIYAGLVSGHNALVYLAVLAVPLTWWVVYRTRFGLRLRAVGESPEAVDTAGISVFGLRYAAVVIAGLLCGFAGTYLAIAQSAGFLPHMTAGRGFIALAALIFAKWKPFGVLGATLLFGFLQALEGQMQGASLPVIGQVPVQLVQALPYILVCVLLAGFIGRAVPPKAAGLPYVKER